MLLEIPPLSSRTPYILLGLALFVVTNSLLLWSQDENFFVSGRLGAVERVTAREGATPI